MDPPKAHEQKFRTHEIPTRKHFGPTKNLREKASEPRNSQKKKDKPTIINLSHETPTRKVSDQLITHEGTMEQGNHT